MVDETPYSRAEIEDLGQQLPERGRFCPKCQTIIPQFAELSDEDRYRIKVLIFHGQRALAMAELRAATGCSFPWAKIWVGHAGKPDWTPETIAFCPYCEKPLRTPIAKQCRHCLKDWHDAANPTRLR